MRILSMLYHVKLFRHLIIALLIAPSIVIPGLILYVNTYKQPNNLAWIITLILCLVLLVIVALSIGYAKKIVTRIVHIQKGMDDLSQGHLVSIPVGGNDEISVIASSLNQVSSGLKQVVEFTEQIGAGNLETTYQPSSDSDALGLSVVKMKDDLVRIKQEDQKRNWVTESLAGFADILQSTQDLKILCENLVQNLVKSLHANQGAIFVLNDDQEGDVFLEMKACYAYNRSKHFTKRVALGNGILGQAFLEKETVLLTQVPKDFVNITSGLGEATPTCLLIVPLKMNEVIIGLVEIASFEIFEKFEISFVEKLAENIANTINAFRVNDNTKKLLSESQFQTEQMRAQEEELRQNQEELQATQEEISRKYKELFKQLADMNYQSRFDLLKSITATKKRNVEYYFEIIRNQIITFAEDKTTIHALREFRSAFQLLGEIDLDQHRNDYEASLDQYYANDFIKKLNDSAQEVKSVAAYLPDEQRTIALQYYYISSNHFPTGEKYSLLDAHDGSDYSKVHATYHSQFRSYQEKFGYYDIFLIDPVTGHIVYSVFKEVDFGTSLLTGPYRDTNFGRVVKEAIETNDENFIRLIDFEPYDPSYRAPASFIACPVYEGGQKIGIVVFQMPINRINQLLTGDNKWEDDGLGRTGETLLVGADYKLRSISRKLIQQPEAYFRELEGRGYAKSAVSQMKKLNTNILLEALKTGAVTKALGGSTGTQLEQDHELQQLIAFAPLQIKDVTWIILSKMEEAEASEKINNLRLL